MGDAIDENVSAILGPDAAQEPAQEPEAENQNPAPAEGETGQNQETPTQEPTPEPDNQEKVKLVPHQALHEERMRRQELQAELQSLKAQMEQFKSLKEELESLRNKSDQSEDQAIAKKEEELFEEDPIEALRLRTERLQKALEQAQNKVETSEKLTKEQIEQQQRLQEIQARTQADVASFMKENPDYPQAFEFLMESRIKELQALGLEDHEIQQTLAQEALALSVSTLERGRSPAEAAYNLAKAKGYKPQTKSETPTEKPTKDADSLEEQMKRLEAGQKMAQSNSGGQSEGKLTLAAIESMSDDEFDRLWAQLEKENYGNF